MQVKKNEDGIMSKKRKTMKENEIIKCVPFSPIFVGRIEGIDTSQPVNTDTAQQIRKAITKHKLIVIPG